MKTSQLLGVVVAMAGLVLVSGVKADQLKNASLTLSDSRPTTSNTHTFLFTHTSGSANLYSVRFVYCTTPSGTCTTPTNLVTTTATEGTVTGLTAANWSVTNGTNGTIVYHAQTPENLSAGTVVNAGFGSVTNSQIDDCQAGGDTSSDTCYVRITSYSDNAASTAVDTTIVSYTIVSAVTVSARVDPTFTFVVSGVAANQVRSQITTSVASTYNTLPFSNLTAGTPKYAAHQLNVTTNTQGGYTVSAKVQTQLTGVYTSNNIDPFVAAWGSPTTWTEPTGSTPNDNTGWFGANTTDTDVSGWGTPNGMFGAMSGTAVTVMQKSGSDNGTVADYVTYALEANVFQPADTYTGTLVYNALPTY